MSTEQKTGITEESPGVRSSKRVVGICATALGGALLTTLFFFGVFRTTPITNSAVSIDAATTLFYGGLALLGITVAEAFAQSKHA